MNLAKFRPGHREHLRRGIQFHRAGSKRNHGSRQRQVSGFEPVQITHQPGLSVMSIENRVRQIRRPANELFRDIAISVSENSGTETDGSSAEKIQQSLKILFGNRFIETDPDGIVIEKPEIDQGFGRLCEDRVSPLAKLHPEGIKTRMPSDLETEFLQTEGQASRPAAGCAPRFALSDLDHDTRHKSQR